MALVFQVPRERLLGRGSPWHGVSGMPLRIHDVTRAFTRHTNMLGLSAC